ncbi:MAG: tyrosine-type recombinase/integrase [Deltaproteobacteria bacterium]|nr:tyrosine-type recombinase/integrase [Deltaproteobacteria bacterium]
MAISKRANGYYQARIKGPDGHIIARTYPTKKEAQQQELRWKQQKWDGILGTAAERHITLNQYFDEWYKDVTEETPERMRSGWRKGQKQMYDDYIRPFIGDCRLKEIRPNNVKRILCEMANLGKSEQTRLHVFGILRKMFGDAIEVYQYLTFNPALRKLKPTVAQQEARHLNLEQTRRLLTHVEDKKYGLAIWIQLYLGLRVGELQALRWEEVDLEAGRITIRRTYVRKTETFRDYPKGRKQHSHNLPPEIWEKLIEAKMNSKCEFVVTSPLGNPLPYRWYLKALNDYCKEIKISVVSTHGLRHSTSELYMSHGATRDDLRSLFAHSSLKVTERYLHGKDTNLEKVTNVINLFGKCVTPKRPLSTRVEKIEKQEVYN